jgi:hypothetical protein
MCPTVSLHQLLKRREMFPKLGYKVYHGLHKAHQIELRISIMHPVSQTRPHRPRPGAIPKCYEDDNGAAWAVLCNSVNININVAHNNILGVLLYN